MKTSYYYESTHDKNDTVEFHIGLSATTLPHFHRSFEMLYVCRGKAHFTVNGQSFEAGSDEIAFVHKCCVHELVPDVDFTDFVLIIGPRFSEDFSKIFQAQTLQPHLADRQFNRTVRPYFGTLHTLAGRKSPAEQLVKKGLVNAIVGSLVAHYPAVPVSTTPNIGIIVQTLNYIDDHFAEPITLDSISSEFGYNKYYF